MSDKTNAFETDLLEYLFDNTSLALDGTNVWVALCTTPGPTETGDMSTEITLSEHAQYTRVAVARTGAGFAVSGGVATNAANITWAQMATGTGGTVTHAAICKGSTIATNDALYFTAVAVSRAFSAGVTLQIDTGDLTITEA
jgi:hypothetical protein